MYYNNEYIKHQLNDCKGKIQIEKKYIYNFLEFYNKYKDIDINNLSLKEENKFLREFQFCPLKEKNNTFDTLLIKTYPALSVFDKIQFCNTLTGKNFTTKTIYTLDNIFIDDIYDDKYLDYLYSELFIYKVEILCDEKFDNEKTYTIKNLVELFKEKEIIILNFDTVRSKSFSYFNEDVILYGVLQSNIIIGDYLAKKGTKVTYNTDEIDILTALCLPNIYNFQYTFDYQIKRINRYRKIYPDFAKVAIQEILKMIPNEIKLRRENIEKLIQDTKNNINNYSKEYKQWLKKEISKQDKLISETVEELDNTIEDNFTL